MSPLKNWWLILFSGLMRRVQSLICSASRHRAEIWVWDPQSVDLLFGFLQFSPGAAETHGLVTWYQDYQVRSTCGLGIVKKNSKNHQTTHWSSSLNSAETRHSASKASGGEKSVKSDGTSSTHEQSHDVFAPTYPDSDPNLRDSKPSTTINQSENHPKIMIFSWKKHEKSSKHHNLIHFCLDLPGSIETCQISLACCSSCSDKPGVIFRLGSDQPTNRNGP